MNELGLIDDQRTLDEFVERLSHASNVAVDTEFVRETTYFPKLCLLQLATPDTIAGIDCLAGLETAGLYETLYADERCWILHSARQDLEVLWNTTGRLPQRIIDTQIAAALVGFTPQISLREALAETLGIELDKTHTRTDWAKRPVAEAPLKYALDDVRHLPALWAHLQARLIELGRIAWFEEDTARLVAAPPVTDATTLWSRLRGVSRLSPRAQSAALALVRWREREAQRLNRPRRWILADTLVTEIARAAPGTRADLKAIAEMPKRLVARAGADILAALGEADERPPAPAGRLEQVDKGLVKALQAKVGARAEQLQLHPEVLATRRDLTAVAAGEVPEHLAAGWRAQALAGTLGAPAQE